MIITGLKNIPKVSIVFSLLLILASCNRKEHKEDIDSSIKGPTELAPEAFKSKLASIPDAVLIDVRKPEELADGLIKGAVNIDYTDSTFTDKIGELDKSKTYFVYCKVGKRSASAARQMEESGFENIYILEGGYISWVEEGLETVKP